MVEESLAQIGLRNRCDKVSPKHPKTHHYLYDIYPVYFEPLRQKSLTILEIGVKYGASLRTWRDYFPYAQIYGIEIQRRLKFEENRIKVFTGDQSDVEFLQQTVKETGPLDIVIDDGLHLSSAVVPAFQTLWPHLNPGGLYFIEDMWYISVHDRRKNEPKATWHMFSDLARGCSRQKKTTMWGIDYLSLELVHFWRHMAIVKKRDS